MKSINHCVILNDNVISGKTDIQYWYSAMCADSNGMSLKQMCGLKINCKNNRFRYSETNQKSTESRVTPERR